MWKAEVNPKLRLDVVNVIARDEVVTVYLRKSLAIFRSKNKSGRIIIIPVKKGIVECAGMGEAYRFDIELPPVD